MAKTQEQLNADILGLTLVEYRDLIGGDVQKQFEDLIKKLTESNSEQDAADLIQKSDLTAQEKKLAELTSKKITAIAAGATQPAKSAAANQKKTAIQIASDTLRSGLDERQATREGAFANTITRLQLDVSEGGSGARADRTLAELATQTDVITNGARAARELSTDSSLRGFFTRGLVGNPYAEGVSELKGVQDDLRGSFDGLNQSANNSFQLALEKDTPLSELTTRFNADTTQATANADALLQTGLIAPEAAQLQAQGINAEIQQTTTAGNLIAQRFDIDTRARERDNAIDQFQFSTQNSLTNQQLTNAANLGRQASTFLPVNQDGSLYDTTTFAVQNDRNQAGILSNNSLISNDSVVVSSNNRVRSTKTLVVDEATGVLDPVQAKAKADADSDYTSFQRNVSKSEAALLGLGANGVIDPKVASTAAKTYAREVATKYIESGTAEAIAKNQFENVGESLGNVDTQRGITTQTLKAKAKTIAQELGNLEAQILIDTKELSLTAAKVDVSLEDKEGFTELQRTTYNNNLILAQQQAALLADKRYLRARMIAGVEGAEVDAAKVSQENTFLQNTEIQSKQLSTRILAAENLYREAVATGSPQQIATAVRERKNSAMRTQVEAQELSAVLAYVNSSDYVSDTLEQRRAKTSLLQQEYLLKKMEVEAAIENQPAVNTLTQSQLALEQQKTSNAAVAAGDTELQRLEIEAARARSNAAIAQGQALIKEGTTTANNISLVNDAYNKITGKQGDARASLEVEKFKPDSVEAKILLEFSRNGGRFADNPYANMEKLNKIQAGEGSGPVYNQVVSELRNMSSALPLGKKITDNSTLINSGIAQIMSGPATKRLDSTAKTNTILDVPDRNSIIGVLPTTMQEAVSSVRNWDNGSMQDKLTGLKDFYTAEAERQQALGNGPGPVLPVVAKRVADTMRQVMDAKARLGKFSLLGIPDYTSLKFNTEVSVNNLIDGKVNPAIATRDRNAFQQAFDNLSTVVLSSDKVEFDVLDQTSILNLMKLGNI